MEPDERDPAPCAPEIYKNGTLVLTTHTISVDGFEEWVQAVARRSGQPVDWHFVGGVACVLALGDLGKVREAILALKDQHDALQSESAKRWAAFYGGPMWTLYGPDEWNPAHEFARQENVALAAREGGEG